MSIADELITRGWTSGGDFFALDGSVCLYGAAVLAHPRSCAAFDAVRDAVALVGGGPSPIEYNDTPGRTFDEVLRVAKLADELLDAQR